MKMKITGIVRDALSVVRSFLSWVVAYLKHVAHRNSIAEYCHVCQSRERPLQLGRYMIRTGPRKDADINNLPPLFDVYVCSAHHPDPNVLEARLAHETQDLLKKLGVSAQCIYFYHHNRQ